MQKAITCRCNNVPNDRWRQWRVATMISHLVGASATSNPKTLVDFPMEGTVRCTYVCTAFIIIVVAIYTLEEDGWLHLWFINEFIINEYASIYFAHVCTVYVWCEWVVCRYTINMCINEFQLYGNSRSITLLYMGRMGNEETKNSTKKKIRCLKYDPHKNPTLLRCPSPT